MHVADEETDLPPDLPTETDLPTVTPPPHPPPPPPSPTPPPHTPPPPRESCRNSIHTNLVLRRNAWQCMSYGQAMAKGSNLFPGGPRGVPEGSIGFRGGGCGCMTVVVVVVAVWRWWRWWLWWLWSWLSWRWRANTKTIPQMAPAPNTSPARVQVWVYSGSTRGLLDSDREAVEGVGEAGEAEVVPNHDRDFAMLRHVWIGSSPWEFSSRFEVRSCAHCVHMQCAL